MASNFARLVRNVTKGSRLPDQPATLWTNFHAPPLISVAFSDV